MVITEATLHLDLESFEKQDVNLINLHRLKYLACRRLYIYHHNSIDLICACLCFPKTCSSSVSNNASNYMSIDRFPSMSQFSSQNIRPRH